MILITHQYPGCCRMLFSDTRWVCSWMIKQHLKVSFLPGLPVVIIKSINKNILYILQTRYDLIPENISLCFQRPPITETYLFGPKTYLIRKEGGEGKTKRLNQFHSSMSPSTFSLCLPSHRYAFILVCLNNPSFFDTFIHVKLVFFSSFLS